ncbi:MAG: SRPBCC family protein [Candidatus Hydrogenedentota bacterium]
MPVIVITTIIDAERERVFDLSLSIDAHVASASRTNETAVDGKISGLIGMGEEVTWQARHFGVTQRLRIRVTDFQRPSMFTDEMVFGAFQSMRHVHQFIDKNGKTEVTDEFRFRAPFGILGRIAEKVYLTRYMRSFLG